MARITIAALWFVAMLAVAAASPVTDDAAAPATAPAETPETAPVETPETAPVETPETAPVETPTVKWLDSVDDARAAARQRDVPIVIVYLDPDAPASIMLVEEVLPDPLVAAFLADTAAAKVNATIGAGKKLFEKTGAKEPPLTQVLAPDGELLDSIPGVVVPADLYRSRLTRSMDYWRASRVKPLDLAARFKAVQARLKLSTRAQAAKDINALLKLPADKLPEGVTPARLHVAAGVAAEKPEQAVEQFEKAIKLAPKDPQAAGRAMLQLGRMASREKKYRDARARFQQYVNDFPDGPDIGRAWYDLAMADYAVDGPAKAIKTLETFMKQYPDNPDVVMARELLEGMKMLNRKDARK